MTPKTEIEDLKFPLDILPENRFYTVSSNNVKEVKSGYYNSIFDVFLSRNNLDSASGARFYVKYFENQIKIYDSFQYELNGDCNDCLPRITCYYFDGRYAVLTNEDEYRRIIMDLNNGVIFLIDYNPIDKTKITNVVYLDEALNPIFFIENQKLSFYKIDKEKGKQIVFSKFKQKENIKNLSYKDIILIYKLFKGNDYIQENLVVKEPLPHYFFP